MAQASIPKGQGLTENSSELVSQPATELRRLRNEAGVTREELARKAGLSVYAIAGYEQGRFGMKVTALNRLADALGVFLNRSSSELLSQLAEDHRA